MKIYEGERNLSGAVVTVDGRPLDPRRDLRALSSYLEWTYEGPGPEQLALALLADHLGDEAKALRLAGPFMREVVAYLDNAWRLTSDEIAAAVAGLEAGEA